MAVPLYGQTPQVSSPQIEITPEIFEELELEPAEPTRELKPLLPDEVKGIVAHEIQDALGGLGSQVAEQRRKAIRHYYGRPFGNEQEGRSQIMLTDVADSIDWMMPSLMRMFAGPILWRFKPTRPGFEAQYQADQATDVLNKVFYEQSNGFEVLFDWFKTALLEKNGIVRPSFEERYEPDRMTYRGLTEMELYLALEDESTELVALDEITDGTIMDVQTGQPMRQFDVEVVRTKNKSQLRVYGVPPEEFLIARRAITLNDYTPFTAHRQKVTVSDLISMGFPADMVSTLPSDDTPEFSQGRTERLSEDETYPMSMAERADAASRELWTTNCFIRIDEDGDGYAELRNILVVGEQSVTVIDDSTANFNPFCSITPNPMPHKFFGLSVADQTMDLQIIRSTLLRQMMDNIYLTNNTRQAIVEGMVDIDDYLTSRPGGYVRVTSPDAIRPIETRPLPPHAMEMLEFLDGVRETRTGVSKWQQGPDASSLRHQTEGGISKVMTAANQKIELIGRTFAETGVKELGRKMLRLFVENNMKAITMRLRGEWVEVDPRDWDAEMDLDVEVGFGPGAAEEQLNYLQLIAANQKQMLDGGLAGMMVTPQNVYNTAMAAQEAMGYRHDPRFFTNPGEKPFPKPEPPSEDKVKMQENEQKAKDAAAKNEITATQLAVKNQQDRELSEFRLIELRERNEVNREQIASQERIAFAQIEATIKQALASKPAEGSA